MYNFYFEADGTNSFMAQLDFFIFTYGMRIIEIRYTMAAGVFVRTCVCMPSVAWLCECTCMGTCVLYQTKIMFFLQ